MGFSHSELFLQRTLELKKNPGTGVEHSIGRVFIQHPQSPVSIPSTAINKKQINNLVDKMILNASENKFNSKGECAWKKIA